MNWLNNDNFFRMLQMSHRLVSDPNQPTDEAIEQIKGKLLEIKNNGMGGIVTNVCYTEYLENEHFWELFRETVRLCKELDLRVWLYDEKGYPSGGAGGLVVRDHPEFEAQGLVCLKREVKKTAHLVMPLPHGHDKVIKVFAVEGKEILKKEDNIIDLSDFVDCDGTLCWNSTINGTVYYIVSKKLFEGVHAARNYHQVRRYADVLNKDAIKYFIDITYAKYKEYVGDYFGNTIEAVFTDEPSVMSRICAVLSGKLNEPTQTEPDEKIPLYPHIVWTEGFEEIFRQKKGYDILPFIPLLFDGDTEFAQRVRYDYHEVAAACYEEAYFAAIGKFCSENNLKFTGHLLGEENLLGQVIDEYDYFQMMKHMHYTGIDVLTADPKRIIKTPLLPKIATSVAHLYGKETVMSETSAFMENQRNEQVSAERVKASVAAQYACGITQIASYFPADLYALDTYNALNDSISRIGQLLHGGNTVTPMLVYYPCRSAWQFNVPTEQISNVRDYKKNYWDINISLQNALATFTEEKVDYDLTDLQCLMGMSVKNGKLISEKGPQYNALYISAADLIAEGMINELVSFAENGVKIYIEETQLNNACQEMSRLLEFDNVMQVENPMAAVGDLKASGIDDVTVFSEKTDDIAFVHKVNEHGSVYMFINTNDTPVPLKAALKEFGNPMFFDTDKNTEIECDTEKTDNGITFNTELSGYQVLFAIFN